MSYFNFLSHVGKLLFFIIYVGEKNVYVDFLLKIDKCVVSNNKAM